MFGIGFLFFNRFLSNLGSEATSLFDVQRWMFNVRCLFFKKNLFGINLSSECLQNNLALMERSP